LNKINKMKLLITGVNGFVAGSVVAQANKNWEIHGIARRDIDGLPDTVYVYQLDLLDNEKLTEVFRQIKPDAVIHTAAMANIDVCEKSREEAENINVRVTKNLADLCKEAGAKLVFCSTDSVFDGIQGNYSEQDERRAINFYAETKIKAEKIVLDAAPTNAVARLALVMGMPVIGAGNSFLDNTLKKWDNGEAVKFPENEIRTPVDVVTLGAALVELAGNDFGGIIHLSGNTCLNRYQMALQIAESTGHPASLVIATDSNKMEGRAPRANDVSLNNALARKILKTPMLSLEEGLKLTMNFKF